MRICAGYEISYDCPQPTPSAAVRLRSPLSTVPAGIASRRFRDAHHHGFWPQQLAVAWDRLLIAEPEGPSFISRTVAHRQYS